ncbi:unnamed protein product [Prunus armeniaca]
MARQFRYDWVQGQQHPEHRFVGDPDDYDNELGFDPTRYELFQGMYPGYELFQVLDMLGFFLALDNEIKSQLIFIVIWISPTNQCSGSC